MATDPHSAHRNVFDIFSGLNLADVPGPTRILRLAPEYDGICMLYSNYTGADRLYSMKILCWALLEDGTIDGVVPWFDGIRRCSSMDDAEIGLWEGYHEPQSDHIFFEPPVHKACELQASQRFFARPQQAGPGGIQEIADTIGTHALFIDALHRELTLTEVISWRLHANGRLTAMLIDQERITTTPVLPGDPCLRAAEEDPTFHYFFQHDISNQIKSREPEAMAAVAMLLQR